MTELSRSPLLPDTWEEYTLLAILGLLAIATLLAIGTILITRWRIGVIERKKQALRDSLGELIVRYASGDLAIGQIEQSLSSKIDYIVLLELVNSLERSLDGEEQDRLRDLMELRSTADHFLERFEGGTPIEKAKACLYFARVRSIDRKHLPQLLHLTKAGEPFLCYSAATALMAHGNYEEKRRALDAVLRNPSIYRLAVTDLIVTFTAHGLEYHDEEADILLRFVRQESIPPERRARIIYSLEQLGYFHTMESLLDYFNSLDKRYADPVLLEALVRVLAAFGVEEILPDLYRYLSPSPNAGLRKAAADAYGVFANPTTIPHLHWLVNDPDYQVRYRAAVALSRYPGLSLESVPCLTVDREEWQELMDEISANPSHQPL